MDKFQGNPTVKSIGSALTRKNLFFESTFFALRVDPVLKMTDCKEMCPLNDVFMWFNAFAIQKCTLWKKTSYPLDMKPHDKTLVVKVVICGEYKHK